MLLRNSNFCKYDIMIELKYIKKQEFKKYILEEKKKEAREQLLRYSEDDRIDKENLKRYIVIFVGNNLKLLEEV